jgi:hypothetical protein
MALSRLLKRENLFDKCQQHDYSTAYYLHTARHALVVHNFHIPLTKCLVSRLPEPTTAPIPEKGYVSRTIPIFSPLDTFSLLSLKSSPVLNSGKMKVLIATMPFTGHINPFQRVAAELIRRGHEVLWLTGDDFREKVEITGATFVSPNFRFRTIVFDRKVGLGKGGFVILRLKAHGLLLFND